MPHGRAALGSLHRLVRALRWGIALVALALVAWVVPVRDHCWDPRSPASTRVAVSRDTDAALSCVLHARTGDVPIDAAQCARLACEPGVISTFARVRPGVLAGLLVLYALGTLAWAARWRALLRLTGVHLPLGDVWRVSIEAQAGGILLPGGIGGDALRIASVVARLPRGQGERSGLMIAVGSVLLDRAVGLAVLGATAALLAYALGGAHAGPFANGLALLPIGFVLGVAAVRRTPLDRVNWLVTGRVGRFAGPMLEYIRDRRAPRALAVAGALSALVACAQFVTIRGLVLAVGGVPTTEKWVYIGTAMAFVVSALPALPGAWGTADATYVLFFGFAGLAPGVALTVCLIYRLFWYACAIIGAALYVARRAS
jgi:uncharacterized membrane protein YbhN (UPF0104 family)